jgi:hypothetical protein
MFPPIKKFWRQYLPRKVRVNSLSLTTRTRQDLESSQFLGQFWIISPSYSFTSASSPVQGTKSSFTKKASWDGFQIFIVDCSRIPNSTYQKTFRTFSKAKRTNLIRRGNTNLQSTDWLLPDIFFFGVTLEVSRSFV